MMEINKKTLLIGIIFCSCFFQGCINDKSRKNHKWTFKVCDSLYAETFSTFGQGAWGGDRDGKWLTDSATFRIFLGAFDETKGGIYVECKKDSVYITQKPDDLDVNSSIKAPVTKAFHLNDLKSLRNLNDY